MGRVSRRAFLHAAGLLTAAAGAARFAGGQAGEDAQRARLQTGGLRAASALPLPTPHDYDSHIAEWPSHQLNRYDLVLVPAYAAADFIARGLLGRLTGPRGRAHDPDGAYTLPFAYRIGLPAGAAGGAAQWDELDAAAWPDEPRLALGAALMRWGYSPNDRHPGRVAQAQSDLANPLANTETGTALKLLRPEAAARLAWPEAGALLIEYDWVLPAGAARGREAAALLAELAPTMPPALPGRRLIPLMPLTAA